MEALRERNMVPDKTTLAYFILKISDDTKFRHNDIIFHTNGNLIEEEILNFNSGIIMRNGQILEKK